MGAARQGQLIALEEYRFVRIVVLVKPVPDPASAGERLGPDGRLDRAAVPAVVNGNDEYALEAALKLIEAAGEGEVTLMSMAPPNAPETLRKALAMGATRGVHITDPALAGSCAMSTARVLAAAVGDLEFDLALAGIDSSDGVGGIVPAAVAAHLGLPYLSYAARIQPDAANRTVRVRRIERDWLRRARGADAGRDRLHAGTRRAPLPVAQGDHGGAQQGDRHAPRWRTLGLDAASLGGAAATTTVLDDRMPAARAATEVVRGPAADGAARIVDFLVERRLI